VPQIRVIVISSVRPEPTSAGQLILYRHLVDRTGIELEVYGSEQKRLSFSSSIRRLVGRLGRTGWHRFTEDFWAIFKGRWLDAELPTVIDNAMPTVVITVAHGDGHYAAQRFAQKHGLPLITFFHDWWPDCAKVHGIFRHILERHFSSLYQKSSAALCVSDGMIRALGPHPNAIVLPPVAATAAAEKVPVKRDISEPFRVQYFGNLTDYGPMLGEALTASMNEPNLLLQVRGNNPPWPPEFAALMKRAGRLLDFAPRDTMNHWLSEANSFLIPMVFEQQYRRRMETCFPSKLIEASQFGKPLVIWGPEYCSAIQWGKENRSALCVTDSSPSALVAALKSLATSTAEVNRLAAAASSVASTAFSPHRIQDQFRRVLEKITVKTNSNRASTPEIPSSNE